MAETFNNRIPRQDILGSVAALIPLARGYIADICHPPLTVNQISGTRPAQLYNSSGTAQSGRAHGGTITGVNDRTANLDTFSCVEKISRQTIDVRDTKMFGGAAGQELALGVSALREIRDAIESAVVTNVQASPVGSSGDPYLDIRTDVQALAGFGDVIIVGNYVAFDKLRQNSTVIERMKATGVPVMGLDVREYASAQLAAIFGASAVFEARGTATSAWNSTILTCMVQADPNLDPMSIPQVGRRYVYAYTFGGEENQTITVEQGYDISVRNDVLDFVTYTDSNTINSAFQKVRTIA